MEFGRLREMILFETKPIEGARFITLFSNLIHADKKVLEKWEGNFDQVLLSKVVLMAKKKGMIEEHTNKYNQAFQKVNSVFWSVPILQVEAEE